MRDPAIGSIWMPSTPFSFLSSFFVREADNVLSSMQDQINTVSPSFLTWTQFRDRFCHYFIML